MSSPLNELTPVAPQSGRTGFRLPERVRWQILLAALVVLVGVSSMPASLYSGDPWVVRAGTSSLIERGELGIPYALRSEIPSRFLVNPRLFFYGDDEGERLYTRYRSLNSILLLPPMLVERVVFGPLKLFHHTLSLVVALNLYNVLISVMIACYLFALASRLTKRKLLALGMVLCSLYSTYLWSYLRAQTSEVFQVCFFLGFACHFFAWAERSEQETARGQFVALVTYGALLTLLKPYYGLVFPLAWVALQIGRTGPDRRRAALADALRLGPVAAAVAGLVLVENALLFGGPLQFAGAEYTHAGAPAHDHFSLAYIPEHLAGFLFMENRSVFTHFPLLILSLFGLRHTWRHHRVVLAFCGCCLLAFLLLISAYSNWTGQWAYGPRYLVFLLPLLGLLGLPAVEWCLKSPKRAFGWVAGVAIVCVLLVSVRAQLRVNGVGFFASYRAREQFRRGIPEIDDYFDSHLERICGDLTAFRKGERPFLPLEVTRRTSGIDAQAVAQVELRLRSMPALRSNYYFAR